jgi:hypothetical protein
MEEVQHSYVEKLGIWLRDIYLKNRTPFLAAIISGLLAHMFMFTNKLVNHDDIEALFTKGATVTSGRWGLEAAKLLFPDWSMPWIYGVITLVLIAISACIMLNVLDIRSTLMRIILPVLAVTFPSLVGTYCFMFTSAAYGLAFLLCVLSVYMYKRGGLANTLLAIMALVLGLGIYQAYIAITASLFVLIMIKAAMAAEKSVWQIVLYGLKALAMMLAALAVYYAITLLVFKFTGAEFNSYVLDNVNSQASIPGKVRMAYDNFIYVFKYRNFYLISTETSRYIHIALLALMAVGLVLVALQNKKPLHIVLLAVLVLLLPLSINCMYLMMSSQSIHTLVLYSFICFYFLGAIIVEQLNGKSALLAKDLTAVLLGVVIVANVYFANMTYLKIYLNYENATAFYSSMIAQIKDTEGFDENSKLAIIGQQDNLLYSFPELDTNLLLGPSADLINIYSRDNFFKEYLGFNIAFADDEELEEISQTTEFEEMAEYPYYGSVKKIGDYIVVKLG